MGGLWHVSEDGGIGCFTPRANESHDSPEPLVWAIDDEHVPAYWGTNKNAKNGFGKCVSTVAHARNAGKAEQQITDAVTACVAKGLKGGPLGACVAARDGVAATKTEAQERKAAHAAKPKSHGKSDTKKGHGKKK